MIMKGKTVSYTNQRGKNQYYQHNYCLVCMTGLLGCRWHRYQQSTRDSRKRDLFNFCLVLCGFSYSLIHLYLWLVVRNDSYLIAVDMFLRVEDYIPWYRLGLGFSAAMFVYMSILVLLSLLHAHHGHQLYTHGFHLLMTLLALVAYVSTTILMAINWPRVWPLVYLSLQVYGPFLQLSAVLLVTLSAWLLIRQWFRLSKRHVKLTCLLLYLAALLALYLAPAAIDSPLIRSSDPLKPGLIAHGGAADIAPENTLVAFKKAVEFGVRGIHTTVQISADGVPFLFEDTTLLRTTNAGSEFAGNASLDPMAYNMSQLGTLNAGRWFLDDDPWSTASQLDVSVRAEVAEAGIPTLSDLLTQLTSTDLYLTVRPLPSWHAYHGEAGVVINDVIAQHVTDKTEFKVYLPVSMARPNTSQALLTGYIKDRQWVNQSGADVAMMDVECHIQEALGFYQSLGLETVAVGVNSQWYMSYVWTAGVDLVTTRCVQLLQDMDSPIYSLNQKSYLILWLVVDLLSAVIIAVLFVVHRIRLYGTNFSPESISLNTGRTKTSYRSRTMKEKLLREGAIIDTIEDDVRDMDGGGVENQPAYSMTATQHSYSLSSLPGPGSSSVRSRDGASGRGDQGLAPPSTITDRYSV